MNNIKLNVGASPIWSKDGWFALDHKAIRSNAMTVAGTAEKIDLPDNSCSVIFCSHVFEHIPHSRLEFVLAEFQRVLNEGGILRILTPDLKKIATAYANNDVAFFEQALDEDENIRKDLGFGGMLMNFIVSPGQDTALFSRTLDTFIAGYAHIYSYDFDMLNILLTQAGFGSIEQKKFCDSACSDISEPLHVSTLPPVWENMNSAFYKKHGLTHYYDTEKKKYIIDFLVTGFDRDPLTSLIIESRKMNTPRENQGKNYERYARSLLGDPVFSRRLSWLMQNVDNI